MTRIAATRDPLAGVTRLLVDGTNLLHALAAAAGRGDRQPPAALIGRLRAAIPAPTAIQIVFDGPPEPGLKNERIAHGFSVRYSGRHSADTILITLVEEASGGEGFGRFDAGGAGRAAADAILVVTDDRELRGAIARRGARTAGAQWLLRRLDRPRLSAPAIGNRRPPLPPPDPEPQRPRSVRRPGRAPRPPGPRR